MNLTQFLKSKVKTLYVMGKVGTGFISNIISESKSLDKNVVVFTDEFTPRKVIQFMKMNKKPNTVFLMDNTKNLNEYELLQDWIHMFLDTNNSTHNMNLKVIYASTII